MPEAQTLTGQAHLLSAQTRTVLHSAQAARNCSSSSTIQARLVVGAHTFSPTRPLRVLHAQMQRKQKPKPKGPTRRVRRYHFFSFFFEETRYHFLA